MLGGSWCKGENLMTLQKLQTQQTRGRASGRRFFFPDVVSLPTIY
jgi:hypothetical protein